MLRGKGVCQCRCQKVRELSLLTSLYPFDREPLTYSDFYNFLHNNALEEDNPHSFYCFSFYLNFSPLLYSLAQMFRSFISSRSLYSLVYTCFVISRYDFRFSLGRNSAISSRTFLQLTMAVS